MNKFIFLFFFILFIFSFSFFIVRAAEMEYPTQFGQEPTKSLPDYVKYIYQFAIWSVGFLGMFVLILGGFQLMTSAGNPEKIAAARRRILGAITGTFLALFSFFIILLINPDLLTLKEPAIQKPTASPKSFGEVIQEFRSQHPEFYSGTGNSASGSTPVSSPVPGALNVPYLSQFQDCLGRVGCAYAATTIVLNYYGINIDACRVKDEMGSNDPWSSQRIIQNYTHRSTRYISGLSSEEIMQIAQNEISQGDVVLTGTTFPFSCSGAHVIVIVGFTSSGNPIIHDPNDKGCRDYQKNKDFRSVHLNPIDGSPGYLGPYAMADRATLGNAIRYIVVID